jgi:hypothetical protein
MLETERIGDVLWFSGAVLPAEEKAFEEAITQFMGEVRIPGRALDLSGLQFISASSAKAVVVAGQEAAEGGAKLKVRASLPVFHRLNALGAGTWLDIEPCQKPNPKPSGSQAAPGRKDSSLKLIPVALPSGTKESKPTPSSAPAAVAARAAAAEVTVRPAELEHGSSVGLNRPGTTGVTRAPVAGSPAEQALLAGAQARAGLPLVAEDTELSEDLAVLRCLVVMRTYTFQIPAAKQDITGRVLGRLGGAWILVDSHGARKIVNMRQVAVIDLLA